MSLQLTLMSGKTPESNCIYKTSEDFAYKVLEPTIYLLNSLKIKVIF